MFKRRHELKIALAGVHVVSAIVSKDFSMGIGAWSWSQHRSGVCQIIKWKRVGSEHKDKDEWRKWMWIFVNQKINEKEW